MLRADSSDGVVLQVRQQEEVSLEQVGTEATAVTVDLTLRRGRDTDVFFASNKTDTGDVTQLRVRLMEKG